MSTKNDGGPAFPEPTDAEVEQRCHEECVAFEEREGEVALLKLAVGVLSRILFTKGLVTEPELQTMMLCELELAATAMEPTTGPVKEEGKGEL